MKLILSARASEEVRFYNLEKNEQYISFCIKEIEASNRRYLRLGSYVDSSTATKNMIKALRLLPALNTPEDWARLHVTEMLLKKRVKV